MRAKTINFERGVSKESLGVGGIQFGVEKYKMKEKLKKDWADFVKKSLEDKTISGTFNKWWYNPETKMPESLGWQKCIVKVKEVSNLDLDDMVIIVSDGKNSYYVPISEDRIHIEE
jgi:hypothetical protein